MTDRAPKFHLVPAGSPSSPCNGETCDAILFWIDAKTKSGKAPIHCDVAGGQPPTATEPGLGVNHFTNCPDANRFHRGR